MNRMLAWMDGNLNWFCFNSEKTWHQILKVVPFLHSCSMQLLMFGRQKIVFRTYFELKLCPYGLESISQILIWRDGYLNWFYLKHEHHFIVEINLTIFTGRSIKSELAFAGKRINFIETRRVVTARIPITFIGFYLRKT